MPAVEQRREHCREHRAKDRVSARADAPHRLHEAHGTANSSEARRGAALPKSASPLSDVFVGKSLRVVTDGGPALTYRFASATASRSPRGDGRAVEAGYGALTLDRVALFTHLAPGTQRGYHVVVDQSTVSRRSSRCGSAASRTTARCSANLLRLRGRTGKSAPEARHALTNRIEGKGFYWRQDTGVETLELYPSTFYSNFVELTRSGGELGFCAPSDYVKINDELYVYRASNASSPACRRCTCSTSTAPSRSACASVSTRATRSSTTCSRAVASGSASSRSSSASATRRDADAGAGQWCAAREGRAPRLSADAQ